MTDAQNIIYNALTRTDSYIVAADQKASFALAAGVTFMGIYASLFYGVLTDEKVSIPTPLTLSLIGIPLVIWAIWFNHVKNVFIPKLTSSNQKSLVSFASMHNSHNDSDECFTSFQALESGQFDLNQDLIKNYWICLSICMEKMQAFQRSLRWFMWAVCSSILSLAFLAAFATFCK